MDRVGVAMVAAVLAVSCMGMARARANERVGVISTAVEGVMIDRAGWVREWDLELTSVLTRARMKVEALAETKCGIDPKCLKLLAVEKHLDLIVGAHILNDEGLPPTYHVKVWVYSVRHGDEPPRALEKGCTHCSEAGVTTLLSALLSEALEPPNANGGAPKVPEKPRAVRPWVVGLGAAGIGVGAILIGLGGKTLADDNQPACTLQPPRTQCTQLTDNVGAGVGFVVPGVILAGAGILAIALEYTLHRRSNPNLHIDAHTDGRSTGLTLSGSW